MMDVYEVLVRIPTFSINDVEKLTVSRRNAYAFLEKAMDAGIVKMIRNNLYSAVDLKTKQVVASKYQIACAASETAYIAYRTAFEYHGLMSPYDSEVSIASETRIREFTFEGVRYRSTPPKIFLGIRRIQEEKVRVTNLERTVIDGFHDMERVGGLQELQFALSNIDHLAEEDMVSYLKAYDIQMLYQKTGYLLCPHQERLHLSDAFFAFCQSKIGQSKRYLIDEAKCFGVYNRQWRLVVPAQLDSDVE